MKKEAEEKIEVLDSDIENLVDSREVEDVSSDEFDDIVEKEEKEDNDKVFDEIRKEKKEKTVKKDSDYSKDTKTLKIFVLVICFIIVVFGCIKFFGSGNSSTTSKRYEIISYDNDKVYKTVKELSINDSIIIRDASENKDITYNFKVTNGKVGITNDYCFYQLEGIKKADKLLVNTMGNLLEDTGVFIITNDGKLYSISLFDDKDKLITDCTSFEDKIDKYDLSFKVKNIESGFYSNKDGSGMEGIILVTDTDDDNHVLTTIKNKSVK